MTDIFHKDGKSAFCVPNFDVPPSEDLIDTLHEKVACDWSGDPDGLVFEVTQDGDPLIILCNEWGLIDENGNVTKHETNPLA